MKTIIILIIISLLFTFGCTGEVTNQMRKFCELKNGYYDSFSGCDFIDNNEIRYKNCLMEYQYTSNDSIKIYFTKCFDNNNKVIN